MSFHDLIKSLLENITITYLAKSKMLIKKKSIIFFYQ